MENKEQYLSLYEYLGKPIGPEQGKQVYAAAKQGCIKCGQRDVTNPKFTGKVLTYPKSFLDFYFKKIVINYNDTLQDDGLLF